MNTDIARRVGDQLKLLRLQNRLSLQNVSENTILNPDEIQKIEEGTYELSLASLISLCSLYKMDYSLFRRALGI